MKIYDVSQELFGCAVFPGDPAPQKEILASMDKGDAYNLTALSLCAHNGTHLDAPRHFFADGIAVDEIPLSVTVGPAFVAEHHGVLTAADAARILDAAREAHAEAAARLLFKGRTVVSAEAARVLAAEEVLLVGNESQTVGPEEAPAEVHRILLGAGVVLLEGLRLAEVPVGACHLSAAPLCLGGADGAPCRAYVMREEHA